MKKPPDEILKQGRNWSWLLVKKRESRRFENFVEICVKKGGSI